MTADKSQKSIELNNLYEVSIMIHNTLTELLKWTKITGTKEVKQVLELKVDTDTKKITYTLSDGTNSTRDIANKVKTISRGTVANYWQEWEKIGLGESIPVMGGGSRFKRSFDLEDFGIKIQDMPKEQEEQHTETAMQSKEGEVSVN